MVTAAARAMEAAAAAAALEREGGTKSANVRDL